MNDAVRAALSASATPPAAPARSDHGFLFTTRQTSRGGKPMTTADLNPARQLMAQGYH
jgi:hypothetical protein